MKKINIISQPIYLIMCKDVRDNTDTVLFAVEDKITSLEEVHILETKNKNEKLRYYAHTVDFYKQLEVN